MPDRIANAPVVSPGDYFYFVAYNELSTCRLVDGGQIPWTAIAQYCDVYAEDDEQAELLLDVIRKVDLEIVAYWREKNKTPETPKGKRGRRGRK